MWTVASLTYKKTKINKILFQKCSVMFSLKLNMEMIADTFFLFFSALGLETEEQIK